MTRTELLNYLTDGLDEEQAKTVREAFKNEKVASRAETLRAAKEFDDLAAREATLKAKLEGGPDAPGAEAYQKWYAENYPKVQKIIADKAALEAKYGTLEAPKTGEPVKPNEPNLAGLSKEDVARLVDERIQGGYADRWSNLLTDAMSVTQKHIRAGRKSDIDMKKLAELAAANGGSIEKAYDEYDKPEREAAQAAATEKMIQQRVNEELQKRGAHANFPSGADMSPGTLSRDRDTSKFDKAAMERDLVNTFISGEEGGGKLTGFGVN